MHACRSTLEDPTAWQHFQVLQFGYQMDPMQQQLADAREEARHLRLEIETLRSHSYIERRATHELHMIEPGPGNSEVIGRVVPAQAPPRSVVARR